MVRLGSRAREAAVATKAEAAVRWAAATEAAGEAGAALRAAEVQTGEGVAEVAGIEAGAAVGVAITCHVAEVGKGEGTAAHPLPPLEAIHPTLSVALLAPL